MATRVVPRDCYALVSILETGAFLIFSEEEVEMNIKEQIAKSIAVALKDQLTDKEIQHLLEKPKKLELGDVAFPCFTLAKTCRKSPHSIAEEIKNNLTCEIIKMFK